MFSSVSPAHRGWLEQNQVSTFTIASLAYMIHSAAVFYLYVRLSVIFSVLLKPKASSVSV
jgi:hypothetical protein